MAVRCLHIVSQGAGILFSKRFSSVEKRAEGLHGEYYQMIPNDNELLSLLLPFFDEEIPVSCLKRQHPPVVSLKNDDFWPFVIVSTKSYLVACFPLVEFKFDPKNRPALVEIPSIPIALNICEEIISLIGDRPILKSVASLVPELYTFISVMMPFGSPMTLDASLVTPLLAKQTTKPYASKTPEWKSTNPKAKQTLTLTAREEIWAVQYDNEDVADVVEAQGVVQCKADVDGLPDVSLTFQSKMSLEGVSTHPHVVKADDFDANATQYKFRFTPPLKNFDLFRYKVKTSEVYFPIRGYYQFKDIDKNTLKLLVQLKMNEQVSNTFEYCDVHMPFPRRGFIRDYDTDPTAGTVSVSADRHELIWHVGPRFPGKKFEVSCPATVFFDDLGPTLETADENNKKDPFLVGATNFVQVSFKVNEYLMSGLKVDASSFALVPQNKTKLNFGATTTSCTSHYKIWNSTGRSRYCIPPVDIFSPQLQDPNSE